MVNIYQRLMAVTKSSGIEKTGQASYGNTRYAYHKIDDLEAMLKPLFVENGIFTQVQCEMHHFQPGHISCNATITFVNSDKPEETVSISGIGEGKDSGDKSAGKAMSYAIKNAYLAAFHLKGQPDVEAYDTRQNAEPQNAREEPRDRSLEECVEYLRSSPYTGDIRVLYEEHDVSEYALAEIAKKLDKHKIAMARVPKLLEACKFNPVEILKEIESA